MASGYLQSAGSGAAAGAPFGPIGAAIGGGIGLISARLGAGAEAGRMKKLREMLERLFSQESISGETNKFFDMFKASPMYGGLRSQAMSGATSLANQLRTSYARRGLGTSGIAGVAEPLARSSFQQSFADIDAGGYRDALAAAMRNLQARAGIITQTDAPSVGAGTIGRGIDNMLPMIYEMLKKYGGGGGGGVGAPRMGQPGFVYPRGG